MQQSDISMFDLHNKEKVMNNLQPQKSHLCSSTDMKGLESDQFTTADRHILVTVLENIQKRMKKKMVTCRVPTYKLIPTLGRIYAAKVLHPALLNAMPHLGSTLDMMSICAIQSIKAINPLSEIMRKQDVSSNDIVLILFPS